MGQRDETGDWFESDEREPRYSSLADLSGDQRRPVSGPPAGGRPDPPFAASGGRRESALPPADSQAESAFPAADGRPDSAAPARVRGPRSGAPLPPPLADPLWDPLPPSYPQQSTDQRRGAQQSGYPGSAEPHPAMHEETSAVDAVALRQSVAESDGLYRSKKPIFLALYGALGVLGELLMLPPFIEGMFSKVTSAALAPLLAMVAFPLLALGLYGLSTGAATAVQFVGPRVWLRTPLIYLPISLALLVAAGAAA